MRHVAHNYDDDEENDSDVDYSSEFYHFPANIAKTMTQYKIGTTENQQLKYEQLSQSQYRVEQTHTHTHKGTGILNAKKAKLKPPFGIFRQLTMDDGLYPMQGTLSIQRYPLCP